MALEIDFSSDGKRLYDLRAVVPDDTGLKEDVICVIRNGEGPTVLLCGGIHGDEYEAQIVLRDLVSTLNVADVRGGLIIIPTINPPASQRGCRLSPVDGMNMNRTFPGKASGTGTERLAAFLHDVIFPQTDLLVDVHAGGADYHVVPMIFGFTSAACKFTDSQLETIMDGWGYPVIEYVSGIASTSAGAAPLVGVASVEIEGGGGTAVTRAELDIMRDGILRGLRAMGSLTKGPGPNGTTAIRVDVADDDNYTASQDGIVEHRVSLMDEVKEGDLLALLHPASGRTGDAVEIRARHPGIILRQRAKFFAKAGELICNTGKLRS